MPSKDDKSVSDWKGLVLLHTGQGGVFLCKEGYCISVNKRFVNEV